MLATPTEAAWLALALSLMLCGAVWTWYAFSRRGLAPGLRGLGLTLLPLAALLTGALSMLLEVAEAVLRWTTGLVLSPVVWVGLAVAALAVGLLAVASVLGGRTVERDRGRDTPPRPSGGSRRGSAPAAGGSRGPSGGSADTSDGSSAGASDPDTDGMEDVEEILRRRGIT